ncbi:MAG: hypothetical protein ABIU20_00730 [Blastocatellia bacterium]
MKKAIATLALGILLATGFAAVNAQTTPGGEMKKSGSEAKKAGTSLGHDVKKGRIVRGGKKFGQHIGRSAKHVGKGVKKAATP